MCEIQLNSKKIKIYGADFREREIPSIRATAVFNIETVDNLTPEKLNAWEENNDALYNGVTFYWDLRKEDNGEELYFLWEHEGLNFSMSQELLCIKPYLTTQ